MLIDLNSIISTSRIIHLKATTRSDSISELVNIISQSENILDKEEFHQAVLHRENALSTGIGIGIAMPHCKIASVKDLTVAIGISETGILDWDTLDQKPVYIVVMIAANDKQGGQYISCLSHFTQLLKRPERRQAILFAKNVNRIAEIFLLKCEED